MSRRLARPVDLSDGVIRLEPLAARHVHDFESLVDDPDVVRFTRVPTDPGEGFVAAWLGGYERGWDDESKAGFAVVEAGSGEFLGFVGFIRFDWEAQESEIGYVIAPAARGRGIAGRAIQLTSRWGFDDLGLERIEAWIDVGNEASQRVAERAGYRREGVRRWSAFKEGKRVDMAIYSLLPGELP